MMDYKEFQNSIVDYLSENLSIEKVQEFDQFLNDNKEHQKEFELSKEFWESTSVEVPNPSTKMDMNFYSMLKSEEEKINTESLFTKIQNFFTTNFVKQFAYTLAILAVGLFIGNKMNFGKVSSEETLKVAKKETENVRSQLVLTLLEQPSANKRLQAVNEVNKLNTVTEKILKSLFSTLNNDDNVNVRLSAVEALKKYTDIPLVREGLIKSIIHQKSPLVQMELADLMVVLQEKKAVKSFEKLIKEKDVNTSAKEKMEESIQSIL